LCPAGYYCPGGVAVPTDTLGCPGGHTCPLGSAEPVPCEAGQYQYMTHQSECMSCPQGFYCEGLGNTIPTDCLAGYYCPAGTETHDQYPCPNGTFANTTNLLSVNQCTPCTPGYYCGSRGLKAPSGVCARGYFCGGGSSVREPFESGRTAYGYSGDSCISVTNYTSNSNDICPAGHYCPEGSSAPIGCPPGTNSSSQQLWNALQCGACTKGFMCPNASTIYATTPCLQGYFCPEGVAVPGQDLFCTRGHFCSSGTAISEPCPAGQYQNVTGSSSCVICPAGYYCQGEGNVQPEICPAGHYCVDGTVLPNAYPCPSGTYNDNTGLRSAAGCLPVSRIGIIAITWLNI
jgi:hypothetical protein